MLRKLVSAGLTADGKRLRSTAPPHDRELHVCYSRSESEKILQQISGLRKIVQGWGKRAVSAKAKECFRTGVCAVVQAGQRGAQAGAVGLGRALFHVVDIMAYTPCLEPNLSYCDNHPYRKYETLYLWYLQI